MVEIWDRIDAAIPKGVMFSVTAEKFRFSLGHRETSLRAYIDTHGDRKYRSIEAETVADLWAQVAAHLEIKDDDAPDAFAQADELAGGAV
jgi:hypothetical protein